MAEIASFNDLERWDGSFPGEHEFATLEGMEKTPELEVFFDAALRLVENWHGNKFAGLHLYGTPGTGKTHAALGLARELHDKSEAEIHYRYVPSLENSSSVNKWNGARNYQNVKNAPDISVFPEKYFEGIDRNPKSVLVLDDYQPDKQPHVAAAVEAAAQFGGLVIITSNYSDPFKLTEAPKIEPATMQDLAVEAVVARDNPDAFEAYKSQQQGRLVDISASLRSRVSAGFKFIEFTGPDRRQQNNFWDG